MLSDEILDKLVERLVKRIEDVNIYALKDIARIIKELRSLRPSDVHKLVQIMQYGGDYRKIVQKLSEINNINEKEIYEIFDEVAKTDLQFAEQFYKYRNKNYIPWNSNKELRDQVRAMAELTANEYRNLSRTLAFSRTVNGKVEYTELSRLYQDIIDRGITTISQGKSSFDQEFRRTIKDLAKSGIKSVNWESGVARRLDSAVRMNLKTGLRELHNETQRIIGKQIDADGVEITVHSNPAPDHQEAQGRQFTNEQYDRLQRTGFAVDVNGKEINMHRELKRIEAFSLGFRPISQYNCYHYSFSVVLGVSKPLFNDEQLQDIMDRNDKGFDYEGKHYSMYEGTQLQRKIETAIRKEKDTQIMAKASGDNDLAQESQVKINQLMDKYVELSNISGLPTKMERLRVDGYKPVKIVEKEKSIPKPKYLDYYENYNNKNQDEKFERVQEVSKIFDNKYKKVYERLNDDEISALKKYSGHYYKDIQRTLLNKDLDDTDNYLSAGFENMTDYKKEVNKWIGNIDSGINKSVINENIVLWKGTKANYYNNAKENQIFSINLYNSTSIDRNIAESFIWNKEDGIILKILVPKGTKGMYMDEFGIGEQEMLLPRDLKYKYVRMYESKPLTEYVKNKKIKIIELEVIK